MRIGVFGGTFDPVHLGHLILAEQCREQGRLDQVWFVPAASPPHKQDQSLTSFAQRVEMLALALAGQPAFLINELERNRPGPSYTVHTLEEIRSSHPDAELFLPIGSDTLHDLHTWYQPARILEMATLLVTHRPGWDPVPAERLREALHLPPEAPVRLQLVESPLIDIASRELRRRAAEGRSLRYLVPRAVEAYIHDKRLYRPEAQQGRS
ncbi:MAG: nicotinate-nucleotide adenylyltransferase [Gemmataceae bacterium]|nr:nicotinate-nucleotide adenylyltransferase [Gemmataceae bacterium]